MHQFRLELPWTVFPLATTRGANPAPRPNDQVGTQGGEGSRSERWSPRDGSPVAIRTHLVNKDKACWRGPRSSKKNEGEGGKREVRSPTPDFDSGAPKKATSASPTQGDFGLAFPCPPPWLLKLFSVKLNLQIERLRIVQLTPSALCGCVGLSPRGLPAYRPQCTLEADSMSAVGLG